MEQAFRALRALTILAASLPSAGCLFFGDEIKEERNPRAGTPYLAESGLTEAETLKSWSDWSP